MPIIQIQSLPTENQADTPTLLKQLCKDIAAALKYDEKHIWATWQQLEPLHYAVGSETASQLSEYSHSPIVRLLSFEGKTEEQIALILETTARVLADGLGISKKNIFIEYVEGYGGRIFDSGQIVYKK